MLTDSKRKIIDGARKGAQSRARGARRKKRVAIRRALNHGQMMNVVEIAKVTGYSPSAVRTGLKDEELTNVEKIGCQYRLLKGNT